MENDIMQWIEEGLPHGTANGNEQFGINVRLVEKPLKGSHVHVDVAGQPFYAESTALKAIPQETACVGVDESIAGVFHFKKIMLPL